MLAHENPGNTAGEVSQDTVLGRGVVPDPRKSESGLRRAWLILGMKLDTCMSWAQRTFPFDADIVLVSSRLPKQLSISIVKSGLISTDSPGTQVN